MDLEAHIIELETKVSYQEHLIQELNDVITAQQLQIDGLEESVQHIREYLKTSQLSQGSEAAVEVPPPHY
ncbi:MAG: SlyX family protein [Mariprofundaceae bacterium]